MNNQGLADNLRSLANTIESAKEEWGMHVTCHYHDVRDSLTGAAVDSVITGSTVVVTNDAGHVEFLEELERQRIRDKRAIGVATTPATN